VRVTAVAKGPRNPVAGGGQRQSAIRHGVELSALWRCTARSAAATAGHERHKIRCRHCAMLIDSRSHRQVSRPPTRHPGSYDLVVLLFSNPARPLLLLRVGSMRYSTERLANSVHRSYYRRFYAGHIANLRK
jgi:hypothetical protein